MYNKSFDKTKYISPILMGGFGNNLFQIATTIKHSEDNGYPMVFGYWTSYNSKLCLPDSHPSNDAGKPNPYFQPWGGWPGTGWDDFTWRNMFPDLPFFDNKDNTVDGIYNTIEERDEWAYKMDTGEGGEYVPLDVIPGQQFCGYFFNHRYWHSSRGSILKYLSFRNTYYIENIQYLSYNFLKHMNTVSINFRIPDTSYAGDKELLEGLEKDLESLQWLGKAMDCFDNALFVVSSNNVGEAKRILKSEFPDKKFYFVIGSPGYQMTASIACAHHIMTSSTFSFWCCYLDPKQPMGKTIYSPNFIQRHSDNMIPFTEWQCIE
jgi:hypothetical protein